MNYRGPQEPPLFPSSTKNEKNKQKFFFQNAAANKYVIFQETFMKGLFKLPITLIYLNKNINLGFVELKTIFFKRF